jgi:hypothetical protein
MPPLGLVVEKLEPDIVDNGRRTLSHVRTYDLGVPASFWLYNHATKEIIALNDAGQRQGASIELPLDQWQASHQDPALVVVSYGRVAVCCPDSLVLPKSVGAGGNNDFSIMAVTYEALRDRALAEILYPLSHTADHRTPGAHAHGASFEGLQGVVFLCDDATYADQVRKAVVDNSRLCAFLRKAKLDGYYVVNLGAGIPPGTESAEFVRL